MARLNLGKVLVTLEGEHDSSRSYDKYCEVTSGGSSYVSKKAVPIGTPITDTAFWQLRASKGADGTDGTNGNNGLDAYQPFKGWYSSTSELNTSFGTPQVGDYAYIKGATANDPVAIYQCTTAGTWTDSGRTFNPSNNQEFASGEALNVTHIVDNLNSSSPTDVLSAKQGKELKGQIDALGPKIDEIEGTLDKAIIGETINLYNKEQELRKGFIHTSSGIFIGSNYCFSTYNIPIKSDTWYSIATFPRMTASSLGLSARNGDNNTPINFTFIKRETEYNQALVVIGDAPVKFKVVAENPYITFCVVFSDNNNINYDVRDTLVFVEGDITSNYVPYKLVVPTTNLPNIPLENIPTIPENKLDASFRNKLDSKAQYTHIVSKNLINPDDVQLNKYLGYTGSSMLRPNPLADKDGACCSGYIPVTPGKTYFLTRPQSNASSAFYFVDETYGCPVTWPALDPLTDEYLEGIGQYVGASRAYKAPEWAKYAIICFVFSGWEDTATQIVGYQFEEGNVATSYEPYWEKDIIPEENLPNSLTSIPARINDIQAQIDVIAGEKDKLFVLSSIDGYDSYIQNEFDSSNNIKASFCIKRSKEQAGGHSECFNFRSVEIINKTTSGIKTIGASDDDIAPINFAGGGYVGANHGFDKAYRLTASGHGKTYADIGSVYTKDSNEFVILDIENENSIIMGAVSPRTYPDWTLGVLPSVGTYSHLSGGTNTGDIVATASALAQLKPVILLDETVVTVDGVSVEESGEYRFNDRVVISQNYKIANYSSIINVLKSMAGTFTGHPIYCELEGIDFCAKLSISYIFTDASHCFIAQTITFLQDSQQLAYFGFMQKGVISTNNPKLYIPKALPVLDGALDLRTNPAYTESTLTSTVNITSPYWENPLLPPDRFIFNNDDVIISCGYLFKYGVGGENRKNSTSNAFFLYKNTRKIYPFGIDNGVGGVGTLQNAGDSYSAVCFRVFGSPTKFNNGGVLFIDAFEFNGRYYIYADFNAAGLYEIQIPPKYVGKVIDVFEKRDNVELLTEITSNTILVKVNTDSVMYGYLVCSIE